MLQLEQSPKEVGILSKGTASTPMMCGGPAGKPWSCDGKEKAWRRSRSGSDMM